MDTNRCTGCQACQLACVIENGLEPEAGWRQVYTFNERRLPGVPLFHLSLACNHCDVPACLEACPALAYSKDPETGAVQIDEDKCIGCRYCNWACPYDAPRFHADRGIMTKCTFCNDRIHRGLQPACAELCPTDALRFEKLPEEKITNEVDGFPGSGLGPSIRIIPLRKGRQEPEAAAPLPEMPFHVEPHSADRAKVSLRSEWSLALFTFLGAVLFASVAAAAAGGPAIHPIAFLAAAAAGMVLGSAHLGRKTRAWRAVLGIARSWISREVTLFALFAVLGAVYLGWGTGSRVAGAAVLLLGVATLFSMDRVYRFAVRPLPALPHSASVLLTGLFLSGVLAANPVIAMMVGLPKILLYVVRKIRYSSGGFPVRPEVTVLRITCGFILPAFLWITAPPAAHSLVLFSVLIGEFVDRCEFYAELVFPSPVRRMAIDLAARIARP